MTFTTKSRWHVLATAIAALLLITLDNSILYTAVSYTHLRAHETRHELICRLLLEKKKCRLPENVMLEYENTTIS